MLKPTSWLSNSPLRYSDHKCSSCCGEFLSPLLAAEDLAEVHRIAGELLKLRDAGAISSDPRDPEGEPHDRLRH